MTHPDSFDDRYGFADRYDEPDRLRDQLRRLLRYRTALALGIGLGLVGATLFGVLRGDSYTSAGEVLVRSTVDPFSPFGVSVDNQVSMGTERRIALGADVAARAARSLHEPSRAGALSRGLSVSYAPDTQVLKFAFSAGSPARAARVTNAFLDAYLTDRQARIKGMASRVTQGLQQQLTPLLAEQQKARKPDPVLGDRITTLQKRIADIRAHDTTGGDIVRSGTHPTRPSGPGPVDLLGLGLLGGLLLGVVLAWLRSTLEPRARSAAEVQDALGAPVLAVLPDRRRGAGPRGPDGTDGLAGTYRALAFRLRHRTGASAPTSLLVVAPRQDGRTEGDRTEAAAAGLAAAFAEYGDDVTLIDATGRTPGLAARLPLARPDDDADHPADSDARPADTAPGTRDPAAKQVADAGPPEEQTPDADRPEEQTSDTDRAAKQVADAGPPEEQTPDADRPEEQTSDTDRTDEQAPGPDPTEEQTPDPDRPEEQTSDADRTEEQTPDADRTDEQAPDADPTEEQNPDADRPEEPAPDAGAPGRITLVSAAPGTAYGTATRLLEGAGAGRPVLVVTGPLLEHTDVLPVAQRVAGVLVLASLDRTHRDDLRRVRELVACSGGHVLGAVVGSGAGKRAGRAHQSRPRRARDLPAQVQPGSASGVTAARSAP
ncbi:hypothetical protein JK359_13690 [Streptomyces actinomycinicus]|uniref:Lipopolysaccharide biosynthesis protein n=1 Tax=Streptomyces actinomycinicus TaxID=1695166 RepID=A0A937JQ28_9ACTN|nr:hypothetical protein [Streptomyces actinomycinicus]MBL1083023.1 hypothetical protein [Streptomyces actinomycinicus]